MTFRPMRRVKQQLDEKLCVKILERNTAGVLAVAGDDGYPYAVPLSYVYREGALYFHCAKTGHKLDALAGCDKVSFCVVDQDEIFPEKYTTYYRSVIVFGRARVMDKPEEIYKAIESLALKYAPDSSAESREKEIGQSLAHMVMVRLDIEHMTGKEAIELVRQREEKM